MIFKFDDSQALQQFNQYNRKDSGSSEVAAFLNPSGRTSRISSVGSQGSAVSRLSGVSGISRSPSPHKMLVETSFCGPKPIEPTSDASSMEHLTSEIENVILARRGDPTRVALAKGVVEQQQSVVKSTKEKLQESMGATASVSVPPMTPAETARAAAKESRRKEIEALKVRLNAINQRQLEKTKTGVAAVGVPTTVEAKTAIAGSSKKTASGSGTVKKVIGVTLEGTEYIRIKLKPDHLYEDHGISPNEKIIEEKEFLDPLEARRKKEKTKRDDNPNQLSHKSPSAAATDNRSPSPASTSVSRKSSFCSFFKSAKDTTNETVVTAKPKTPTTGKSKLNEKSPLPSPSKSSFSSRIPFSLFKTNRTNASPSQFQLESTNAQHQQQSETTAVKKQHQSRQPLNLKDKPRLRYYDAPDNSVIHIPLHTPPEEKEFSALKKKKQESVETNNGTITIEQIKTAAAAAVIVHEEKKKTQHPPQPPPPPPKNPPKARKAPTAQIEKMQSTDELELQELPPKRKPSEEAGSSLWSVEVQRHSSQESQETVISSQPKNNDFSKNGYAAEKPMVPAFIDTINENPTPSQSPSLSSIQPNQHQQPPHQQQQQSRGRHKKHILFCTKIGSGSEEQIFSTQLSLSKTESQSSQLSEQASVFESPKNEECGTKMPEVTRNSISNSLKHQSSSEVEKVTATSVRSRSDHSDSGSRPQSATRKQSQSQSHSSNRSSGEFLPSKKRESSEELFLHKIPRENSKEFQQKQQQHQQISPASYDSQKNIINSISITTKTNDQSLQHQSSGSRMEISSDDEDGRSDIEACIHKRVSRLMEDHESTGLVLQESFDDELPFVPTTLPEERCIGVKIIPTKERIQSELITIPVERPRSTTPINPTSLDNFCERKQSDSSDTSLVRGEKLRISLPRQKAEQTKEKVQQKTITRRISNLSNKSWTEFASEQGLQQTTSTPSTAVTTVTTPCAGKKPERTRKESNSSQDEHQPHHHHHQHQQPQATVVKSHSKKSLTSKWIDFENIPEKRQPPKKITTIPMNKDVPNEKIHNSKHSHHQRHHYVSPEECQCECHESKKDNSEEKNTATTTENSGKTSSDDSQPLLDDNADKNSTVR